MKKLTDIEGWKIKKIRRDNFCKGFYIKYGTHGFVDVELNTYGVSFYESEQPIWEEYKEPHLLDEYDWFDSEIMEFHDLENYLYAESHEFKDVFYCYSDSKGFNGYVYKLKNDRLMTGYKAYGFEWNNSIYPHYLKDCTPSNLIGVVMMKKEWYENR